MTSYIESFTVGGIKKTVRLPPIWWFVRILLPSPLTLKKRVGLPLHQDERAEQVRVS